MATFDEDSAEEIYNDSESEEGTIDDGMEDDLSDEESEEEDTEEYEFTDKWYQKGFTPKKWVFTNTNSGIQGTHEEPEENKTPFYFFNLLFATDLVLRITSETNLYYNQVNN